MKRNTLKITLFSAVFFAANVVWSQNVGINTNGAAPAASAMLDVVSTNRGLLMPRVALTATNSNLPVTAPANSLMVFNTATAGTAPNNVTPGYYYWDGTKWVRFAMVESAGTNTNWSITGNSDVISGTNFLGTTNAQPIEFKTNNVQRMRITNDGNVVVNQTGAIDPDDIFSSYSTSGKFTICGYVTNGVANSGGTNSTIYSGAIYGALSGVGGVGLLIDHNATRDFGGIVNTYGTSATAALKADSESNTAHGIMGENPTTGGGYAVYSNGDLYIAGGVYGPSDKELKSNIQSFNGGLKTILSLVPRKYQYNSEYLEKYRLPSGDQIGLLAQELELVLPQLVKEGILTSAGNVNKSGTNYQPTESMNAKTVNYVGLVPVMISAIQEQQSIIEKQNQRIIELELKMEELKQLILSK